MQGRLEVRLLLRVVVGRSRDLNRRRLESNVGTFDNDGTATGNGGRVTETRRVEVKARFLGRRVGRNLDLEHLGENACCTLPYTASTNTTVDRPRIGQWGRRDSPTLDVVVGVHVRWRRSGSERDGWDEGGSVRNGSG
jgi:hypothetical protein